MRIPILFLTNPEAKRQWFRKWSKVKGIRAALCTDAQTATAARLWNHANVLALSSRLLTADLCQEIITAWFSPVDFTIGASDIVFLDGFECKI